ncbi:alpha-ketoglutarate-dependent dioxygenase alkB homolog 7, mitochondrial-like isoform X2 [Acipenser ruthenus]|uniref:alpha-ketoglutarate-dependent dioxygenase alkB homolog 7, mitochondrial-like isoform X2 n=1 Tax=Acipenser ruthenus TaxID=7906 RepID=UPI00274121F1|nr:alpha-ketoglutarate-dependent dioxygenase alkB homolog 7, mitochondrial-like isoform X2 [Acipenser ruthenus]
MRPRFSLLSSPVRFKALFGSSLLPRSRLGAPGLALSGSRSVVGSGPAVLELVSGQVEVREEFISEEEERELLGELEPVLKRKRYEFDHWDNAIHGYRETERSHWSERNSETLQRVRDVAFPPGTPQLGPVHVLDVDKGGYIKPHVDSVKGCSSLPLHSPGPEGGGLLFRRGGGAPGPARLGDLQEPSQRGLKGAVWREQSCSAGGQAQTRLRTLGRTVSLRCV